MRLDWRIRAAIGFVIAPVWLGIVALPFPAGTWALMMAGLVGYPIAIVLGLPFFLTSKALGRTGLAAYAGFAFVCALGLIAGFVFIPALSQGESVAEVFSAGASWGQALLAFLISYLSVGAFWLIARPDKQ